MSQTNDQASGGTGPAEPALVLSSVVLIAKDVNQSIFSPAWLLKHGILLDEEAGGDDFVFARGLTRVRTPAFQLLVLPDRLQMRLALESDAADALIMRVVGGVVKTLPHTPFSAIGLNFQYQFEPTDAASFHEWDLARFAAPWALKTTDRDNPRTRYGCTFAYDAYDGARMRVRAVVSAKDDEAAPPQMEPNMPPYVVEIHCNLHRDLKPETSTTQIIRTLAHWKDVRQDAIELIRSLQS